MGLPSRKSKISLGGAAALLALLNLLGPARVGRAANMNPDSAPQADDTPTAAEWGGTGRTSLTAESVLLGDGTNPVKLVAPGASGEVLASDGTTWTSVANMRTAGARSSVSQAADGFCHPRSGACAAASDPTLGLEVPFAMTLRNLTAYMSAAQGGTDTCAVIIRTATGCGGTFTDSSLQCAITGSNTCSDATNSVALAAGDCYQVFFDEQGGTCSGFVSWSLQTEQN